MSSLLLFVATRDLPPRVTRFPHLHAAGAPDLCPTRPLSPPTRDWRQAMPRAEPALPQVATLRLPAVAGAATLRGRGSHNHPPATPGRALGLTWRYGTPTATTLCAHGLKGKSGGAVGDRPADHDLGGVAIVFACFIVVVVSQFEDDLSLLAM